VLREVSGWKGTSKKSFRGNSRDMMSEKSFAATPYSCHAEILDVHMLMEPRV
jgi:hypothetical protein